MSRLLSIFLLGLTLSLLSGCGNDSTEKSPESVAANDLGAAAPDTPETGSATTDGSAGSGSAVSSAVSNTVKTLADPVAATPDKPAWPERETLSGNWLLRVFHVLSQSQQDLPPQLGERPVVLLTLQPGEGDAADSLEIIAARDEFEVAVNASGSIDGDRLVFEGKRQDGARAFLFEGRRAADGAIVGSIVFANGSAQSARIVPTDERTFVRVPAFDPLPETLEMMKLANSPVLDEDTRLFVEKYPTSPIATIAWRQLIQKAAVDGASSKRIAELVDEFCASQTAWSERLGRLARFETFVLLIATGFDPSWCLSQVNSIKTDLKQDPELASYIPQLEHARLQCLYRQTLMLFTSEKDEDKQQARKQVLELFKEKPYEPMLTIAMADDARDKGDIDQAIKLYAELVALPFQERILQQLYSQSAVKKILPTERLSSLWKEKHGSTDGLDEFIQKTYDDNLLTFVTETFDERPADSGTHTALLEHFTGTRCAPCIASDIALTGLDRTYPKSMVVALRYHLHIPERDPMTNEDNEARFFNYYRSPTTPSLFLDGIPVEGIVGSFTDSAKKYSAIRDMLVSRYSLKTEATIKLSASRQGDTITVAATVAGADLSNERLRLRIVLAENEIPFLGFNGVRTHSMVVRKLLGGDRGIAAADDQLAYQGTVNVTELRDSLHQYLTQYEQNTGVEFTSMPLDLEQLSVVAFIQDDSSHEILQTSFVPVQSGAPASE
ncbi:hypothetical protein GC176_27030 [bacterium]|nr:hypothetical protein [bacterium]